MLESGSWLVWKIRFAVKGVCATEPSGVWLDPDVVQVFGGRDALSVIQELRTRELANERTGEDGRHWKFTEFRLLSVRPVATINLKAGEPQ